MTDPALAASFAADIVFLRYAGLRPVVVHGGGPQINAQLDKLGIEPHSPAAFASLLPRRWTSCAWCSSVRCSVTSSGCSTPMARSASGSVAKTASCSLRERRPAIVDGEPVDIGLVGDIVAVEPGVVHEPARRRPDPCRLQCGARLRRCRQPCVYNVNADTAAAALAVALGAEKLVVLTDVEGPLCRLAEQRRRSSAR